MYTSDLITGESMDAPATLFISHQLRILDPPRDMLLVAISSIEKQKAESSCDLNDCQDTGIKTQPCKKQNLLFGPNTIIDLRKPKFTIWP